ncbi:uncharacterized protein LOC142907086 isoform X2 [Petromyzon marinus]|uniref:uncharacterized protein LOC142907086 isoform X2 n=1 Tax=Petromyzon marinus TaxID=7757 RepID=UPI003F6F0F27
MANPHGVGSAIPPLIPGLHKRAALLSPRFPMLGSPAMGRGGLLPSPNRFVSPHDSFDRGGGGGGGGAVPVHYRAVGIRPPLIRAPPLMGVVPQPPQRLPSLLPGRMVPGAPISIHPLLPRLGFGRPGAMPPPVKRKMMTPPSALEMGAQAKRARPRHTPSPAPLLKTVARRGHVFAGGKMTLLVPPSSGGAPVPSCDEGRRGCEMPEKNWLTLHCALCSFRTLHAAEMEEHYGGELHGSSLGLLRQAHASDSRVVDFLHECTVHKNRRMSKRRQQMNIPDGRVPMKDVQPDLCLRQVSLSHCLACDVFMPLDPSSVQEHVKSECHIARKEVYEAARSQTVQQVARHLISNKGTRAKFEMYKKGEDPFSKEDDDKNNTGEDEVEEGEVGEDEEEEDDDEEEEEEEAIDYTNTDTATVASTTTTAAAASTTTTAAAAAAEPKEAAPTPKRGSGERKRGSGERKRSSSSGSSGSGSSGSGSSSSGGSSSGGSSSSGGGSSSSGGAGGGRDTDAILGSDDDATAGAAPAKEADGDVDEDALLKPEPEPEPAAAAAAQPPGLEPGAAESADGGTSGEGGQRDLPRTPSGSPPPGTPAAPEPEPEPAAKALEEGPGEKKEDEKEGDGAEEEEAEAVAAAGRAVTPGRRGKPRVGTSGGSEGKSRRGRRSKAK